MTKVSDRKSPAAALLPPRLKIFRPISWHDGEPSRPVGDYIAHLLLELGRLGLEIHDIENHARLPNTETVLSDLLAWIGDPPGEALAQLLDWQALDLGVLRARLEADHMARPRIEISAHIDDNNDMSVRWHPCGWHDAPIDPQADATGLNLMPRRIWRSPPDFLWFAGDEEPGLNARPSNELMFLRGVGALRPEPQDEYDTFATTNRDVVDAILICAVRAAYEGLIRRLSHICEVDVTGMFEFTVRKETGDAEAEAFAAPVRRVVSWRIVERD